MRGKPNATPRIRENDRFEKEKRRSSRIGEGLPPITGRRECPVHGVASGPPELQPNPRGGYSWTCIAPGCGKLAIFREARPDGT